LQEQLFDRNAAVVDRIRWQLQFELNAAHWPSHHDNVRQRIQQAFGRGDWVLEFVSGVAPSLDSPVKGRFRVAEFVGPGGQILVLQTGPSEFPRAGLFQARRQHTCTVVCQASPACALIVVRWLRLMVVTIPAATVCSVSDVHSCDSCSWLHYNRKA
jgi:hypothetical protein